MVVNHDSGIVPVLMEYDMKLHCWRDDPRSLNVVALSVHSGDVACTQLVPTEPQWVYQEGAIRLSGGDVASQVVVVSLSVKGSGQQCNFLSRCDLENGEWHRPRWHGR
jgi:hypothetical protein